MLHDLLSRLCSSLSTTSVCFGLVDVDHAAVDESSPGNILEEVFENERLQPFRVRQ